MNNTMITIAKLIGAPLLGVAFIAGGALVTTAPAAAGTQSTAPSTPARPPHGGETRVDAPAPSAPAPAPHGGVVWADAPAPSAPARGDEIWSPPATAPDALPAPESGGNGSESTGNRGSSRQ